MDPILPNTAPQTAATATDQRPAKIAPTPGFQTPDRQPLVAPPMPVTGLSQIAAVVRGLLVSEAVNTSKTPDKPEADPKEAARILKPYGIGMLPERDAKDDTKDDEVDRDTDGLNAPPTAHHTGSTATTQSDVSAETDTGGARQPAHHPLSAAPDTAASLPRPQE